MFHVSEMATGESPALVLASVDSQIPTASAAEWSWPACCTRTGMRSRADTLREHEAFSCSDEV